LPGSVALAGVDALLAAPDPYVPSLALRCRLRR